MAFIAYGKLIFENELIATYEFGESQELGTEGVLVISKTNAEEWKQFGDGPVKIANAIYSKARRMSANGLWPDYVNFSA